jgi:hypothetical protein
MGNEKKPSHRKTTPDRENERELKSWLDAFRSNQFRFGCDAMIAGNAAGGKLPRFIALFRKPDRCGEHETISSVYFGHSERMVAPFRASSKRFPR